ncbi:uncharacterized protein [Osmerus mordax]|uniref:uncharacterized protein isoform X1 n=2 Tax=Osmerus mordax TaxID=8014 RepID=UPI003510C8E2
MAEQSEKRSINRRLVYCLVCQKPQDALSQHLARVCMKSSTPQERASEVQKAKDSTKNWTRTRNWDYNHICEMLPHLECRLALVIELLGREHFIRNMPPETMAVDSASDDTSATATICVGTSPPSSPQGTDDSDLSSSDLDERTGDPSWQSVRMKMKKAGLYSKFPDDASLISDFKRYVMDSLGITDCQKEVDKVSRFLRYLQPRGDEPNLDFLKKSIETRDYLTRLRLTDMSAVTILKYIQNMKRFVGFLKIKLDLGKEGTELHSMCQAYKELLQRLKKLVVKARVHETVSIKKNRLTDGMRSVADCQEILNVAKEDFLNILRRLMDESHVFDSEKTSFRYYCEAVMVFRHFQLPGAVEGMTVKEWKSRKHVGGRAVIGICHHRTQQIVTLALTLEEEAWLQAYYKEIRPGYLKDSCDKFFISSHGKPLHSVTKDIARLHESYKLQPATSIEVRRAAEAQAAATFMKNQKEGVAHHMAHNSFLANQHYRMRLPKVLLARALMLESLIDTSETCPPPSKDEQPSEPTEKDFSSFITTFPVSTEGQPPGKRKRVTAGFPESSQYLQRREHLLSKYIHQKPSVRKLDRQIKKQGWTANHPTPEEIRQMWKPASKLSIEGDAHTFKKTIQQNWKGLVIQDFGGEKGLRVVTTKPFAEGAIVCDYHGIITTAAEGRQMMSHNSEEDMRGLFFFRAGQMELCIDGHSPCECHGADTFGRRIKHSSKKSNLKPLHCVFNTGEGEKQAILFKAVKDIDTNTELSFDHGAKRKFFRGEGLDLKWLDE